MIDTPELLHEYIVEEKSIYLLSLKHHLKMILICDPDLYVWRYLYCLRKYEYNLNIGHRFRTLYWERKMNKIGVRLGILIHPNSVGKGLKIWHHGNIIIHKDAKVGNYCQLHGMNCIGNKGSAGTGTPIIGNRVNIGVGASVIGPVTIADEVSIAANAVVTHSVATKGVIVAGIPAKNVQ